MAARLPKIFPVRMPDRRFQKRILKRVYTTGDRAFLLGMYALEGGGTRVRPEELSPQDVTRLRSLSKSIGRNRGAVQVPKLVILLVIVAAAIGFNLFFKNALLTRALRGGLESVFGARAEVTGLDFRPLAGRMTIGGLAVADRERPLRNLFELGRTELSLETLRLLEGRVLVRNLECRDVRWDTQRRTSGALAPRPASTPAEGGLAERLGSAGAGLLQAIDVPGFIDEHAAELASARRISEANARLSALSDKWSTQVARNHGEVEALSSRIEAIRAFDYSSLTSLADARQMIDEVRAAAAAVQPLAGGLSATTRSLAADVKAAGAERAAIEASLTADLAFLRSKLDLSPEAWKSLASRLASRVLERYLGRYSSWALRAWDAVEGLIRQKKQAEESRKPLARKGRTVLYPGAALPRFLLSSAAFSLAAGPGIPDVEASLRDVTSDPDIIGRPAVLEATAALGGQTLSVSGTLDTRSYRSRDAELSLRADNWDLALQDGLEELSISSLAGTGGMRAELALLPGGGSQGEGAVTIRGMRLGLATGGDPLASAAAEALRAIPEALVSFTFTMDKGGAPAVSASTNLDGVLAGAVSAQAGQLVTRYEGQVREELMGRLRDGLQENDSLAAALGSLQKSAGADLATTDSYGRVLADAKKQMEKRLKSAIPLPKLGF